RKVIATETFDTINGPVRFRGVENAVTPTAFEAPDVVARYQATITPDDLAAHLYFFASDFFEGRETATRGQKLAAAYLASQYRKMGLKPAGTAATDDPYTPAAYLQPFKVYGDQLRSARLTFQVADDTVAASVFGPTHYDGQMYLSYGNTPSAEGGVVFAGYGIRDPQLGYNDYAALREQGISTTGKWLLMLRAEPMADDGTSLLPTAEGRLSRWSSGTDKIMTALQGQGLPLGILIIGDAGPGVTRSLPERTALAAQQAQSVSRLSLRPNLTTRPYPPIYVISSAMADRLLAASGHTTEGLRRQINASLKPVVFELENARVSSTIERAVEPLQTENVIAFIEGTDPDLKDEAVVLSSHYDHIGINYGQEGDVINNGADDDGSGTVTILEIAEAFMKARQDGYGPRRSILFLNVSGEEKGLLGSAYYADVEPVWPLEKTVANLNLDMVGRFDPEHPKGSENYVYIIGSNLISQELHDINQRVNAITGVNLELDERFNSRDDPNRFYARSDHWNFGKHGIPFIFFFTGTHEDYHQPGDEAHKIAYDRMARIARLVFATAWQVANQDTPPAVTGTGFN
ncbi:MAG: M28 family peptidase, partial [Bacteroidetes bacterium]